MFDIRGLSFAVAVLIMGTVLFAGTGYGLWGHNADVRFKLTISKPEGEEDFCICGTYTTIQEGIDLLKDVQYPKIHNRMVAFEDRIRGRIAELNELPFGGITSEELSQEYKQYMNVNIPRFRNHVSTYGSHCINELAAFYRRSTKEEQDQVPDFWQQHTHLWSLSDQLWDKLDELYPVVNEFLKAGQKKIDY